MRIWDDAGGCEATQTAHGKTQLQRNGGGPGRYNSVGGENRIYEVLPL